MFTVICCLHRGECYSVLGLPFLDVISTGCSVLCQIAGAGFEPVVSKYGAPKGTFDVKQARRSSLLYYSERNVGESFVQNSHSHS
jgi:hypothetical protein